MHRGLKKVDTHWSRCSTHSSGSVSARTPSTGGTLKREPVQNNLNLETPQSRPDLLISFPPTCPWQEASGPFWLLLLLTGRREPFLILFNCILFCCCAQRSPSVDCIAADSIWPRINLSPTLTAAILIVLHFSQIMRAEWGANARG